MGPLLQPLASPPSPDPWGLEGLHAPSPEPRLSPCSLREADRCFHGFQEANAPSGRQPEQGRLVHPGGCGRGDQSWETPCPAMEGLELFGSQQAAMAPALGDLPPALKW